MTDRILLGIITGAHGIRGDAIVRSYAEAPEDVAAYGPLSDEAGTRRFKLKVLRVTPKGAVIVRIAGVSDRDAAEALRGTGLYVARDKLPATDEGEFYHADLVGLAAVAPDGTLLGEIVDVANYGAGDLLEIRITGRRDTELVPFNDTFVPAVDLAGRRATIVLPQESSDEDEA